MNTTKEALQAFGDIANFHLSKNPIPQKGSRVCIKTGKHKGQEGLVMWIGSTYASRRAFKTNTLSGKLIDSLGYNLRIGVDLESGTRLFIDFYDNVQTL
jgi:hypothetical protein